LLCAFYTKTDGAFIEVRMAQALYARAGINPAFTPEFSKVFTRPTRTLPVNGMLHGIPKRNQVKL
jgi:hypothetical protein